MFIHVFLFLLTPNLAYCAAEIGYLADKAGPNPLIESTLTWVPD